MEEKELKVYKSIIKNEFNYMLENCISEDELDYVFSFIRDCKKMLNL